MNRTEQFLDQLRNTYLGNSTIESQLVSNLFFNITEDIISQGGQDLFRDFLDLRNGKYKKDPYTPIPNAQHYIQLFKNIFYKVPIPEDAELYLATTDEEYKKESSIVLSLFILFPDEDQGAQISCGPLPDGTGNRYSQGKINAKAFREELPENHKNVIFFPHLHQLIKDFLLQYESYYNDLKKFIKTVVIIDQLGSEDSDLLKAMMN